EENSKRIRLALLDLDLPKMDGLSCLRRVSAMGQSVPIILMSGNPEFDERVSQLPPRVCFVRKPFSMDEMIDLIFHRLAEEGFGEGAGESKLTGN
ncbi:response regulator, partial [Candidatus Sumerlaeota bacterium]|nr:response regulator [Candidatus Sumerlaeota bacterium]